MRPLSLFLSFCGLMVVVVKPVFLCSQASGLSPCQPSIRLLKSSSVGVCQSLQGPSAGSGKFVLRGRYVYRVNLSEPDRPGPHVWYRSVTQPEGPLTCPTPTKCHEVLSTINFSDIQKNYTSEMVLWREVQPGDYWEP